MTKKRIVFISSMASPFQIKFCDALQPYFNTEFWFHTHTGSHRPAWWKIKLCDHCKILPKVLFKNGKYLSFDIVKWLNNYNPDIVILGGFSFPSNLVAYYWAKTHSKKTVVFTEISRNRHSIVRTNGVYPKFIHFLYKNIDLIMASTVEAAEQHRTVFGFKNNIIATQYPSDIDEHLNHSLRGKKDAYVLLFANRLIDIYDPLLAIDIFDLVQKRYPTSKMLMNASGNLRNACELKIREKNLQTQVKFLEQITSWHDLHKVYQSSDILILPANFSAGNFTIIESMASGMGIVISNRIIGIGAKDIISGQNGYICNPNITEFTDAIENYFNDADLFLTHGQINKNIVNKYSIAATAALWHKNLSTIL